MAETPRQQDNIDSPKGSPKSAEEIRDYVQDLNRVASAKEDYRKRMRQTLGEE